MYAMLSAHFLAALQVLVYAGAIMMLFVFVVMVLNRDEAEPWAWRGVLTKVVGVVALVYLVIKIGYHLFAGRAGAPRAAAGRVRHRRRRSARSSSPTTCSPSKRSRCCC